MIEENQDKPEVTVVVVDNRNRQSRQRENKQNYVKKNNKILIINITKFLI